MCAADCVSGFCVDGVCCNSACKETCKACNVASAPGVCTFVPAGDAPRTPSTCASSDVSTCGLDGTLRRRRPLPQARRGHRLQARHVPGRLGQRRQRLRRPGPLPARPGDHLRAVRLRSGDEQVRLHLRVRRGLRQRRPVRRTAAAAPSRAAPCAARTANARPGSAPTGSAATSRARGACVTCNQPGRDGTCWPIDTDKPDPHGVCAVAGAGDLRHHRRVRRHRRLRALRGRDRVRAAVLRGRPAEHRRHLQRPRQLPAAGRAELRALPLRRRRVHQPLHERRRLRRGQRVPQRQLRQEAERPAVRAPPAIAQSNFCVDGVCCDRRLHGRLPQLRAAVVARRLHAGGRPAPTTRAACCAAQPAPNLRHRRKMRRRGRLPPASRRARSARPERCDNNVYTPRVHLQRDRRVRRARRPSRASRSPATAAQCFGGCTARRELLAGQRLQRQLVRQEAATARSARTGAECMSGNCAQGVCCATACTSACRSCALSGTMGIVHQRPDRRSPIRPRPASTGTRRAAARTAGARRARASATRRGRPARPPAARRAGSTLTPASTCDGAGACVTPPRRARVSRSRAASAPASRPAPATPTARRPPSASCGSCGLKPPRRRLRDRPGDCQSGVLRAGRLLHDRLRRQLHVVRAGRQPGHLQADRRRRNGSDRAVQRDRAPPPAGRPASATAAAAASCTRPAPSARPPSCPSRLDRRPRCPAPATAAAPARPATTQSCGTYACNGTTCNAACGGDGDCAPGNVCNAGSCGIEAPRPAVRRPPANATAAIASTASAARRPRAATASRATSPAWRGRAIRSRADDDGAARRLHPESAVRLQRHVRRQRRLPATAPTTTSCGDRLVQRVHVHAGRQLQRRRAPACRPPTSCAPFACGAAACRTTCSGDGDCAAGLHLHVERLHQPESQRRRLRRRDRMFQRQLHGRLLLRVRQLRQLHLVRGRRQAGDLPAGARRASRSRRGLHELCRVDHLQDYGQLRRQRAMRDLSDRHHLHARRPVPRRI